MVNNLTIDDNIINGRALAQEIFLDIRAEVVKLSFKPLLCDVVVGDDPVSLSYVKIKQTKALECGLDFSLVHLPEGSMTEDVLAAIEREQEKENLCGLIVQLPLPKNIDSEKVLKAIDPAKDVDVINPISSQRFYNNEVTLIPPTPGSILHILEQLPDNLSAESFLVLGQGELVGKPITHLLRKRGYEVNTAIANTPNKDKLLKNATVIITGVGKAGILKGEEISDGVIIIDAGTSESEGSIQGDVDFETVSPKARYITPSPGGVGPITVAKLLENVLNVAKKKS
jgi:methylenetetrahydrofolate dehydrogenase (NADP+) / methenyltetrahydrofolate cyclohydrolase